MYELAVCGSEFLTKHNIRPFLSMAEEREALQQVEAVAAQHSRARLDQARRQAIADQVKKKF